MDYNRNRAALYAVVNAVMDVTAETHPNRNIKHVADIVSKASRYMQQIVGQHHYMETKQWLALEADVLLQVAQGMVNGTVKDDKHTRIRSELDALAKVKRTFTTDDEPYNSERDAH